MMNTKQLKAVVFDCDGVMFDTAEANRKFYDEVLETFGKVRLNQEQFVNVHMMTVTDAVRYLFPEFEDLTEVLCRLKTIGYHKFIPFMRMEPGLVDLLGRLEKNGLIRGIATNRINTMETVLELFGLTSCFDVVMTAAKVRKPKPDPEQLLAIMAQCGLHPEKILFVGDSEYDRLAARGAGTWFAAFKNPDLQADIHVGSMSELAAQLELNEQNS